MDSASLCRFKPITSNAQSLVGRQMNIIADDEANLTVYIKPMMTFDLWNSLPIVVYPKLGVTVQVNIGDVSHCSNESPHYQLYAEFVAGFDIDAINVTIPVINKQVGGLGRPVLPFGHEFPLIG